MPASAHDTLPDISLLLPFLLALLALELTPGLDMMLVLPRGISQGRRVALLTMVGMIFVAGVAQVGLLVLGVASLLNAHPASLLALQFAGAAYLFYPCARMLLSRHPRFPVWQQRFSGMVMLGLGVRLLTSGSSQTAVRP